MTNFKYFIVISFFSLIAVALETTVINFPFVFLIASILILFIKKIPSYVAAFLLGFFVDAVRVSNFGMTPVFIFAAVVSILLFEKYSGSKDTVVASFIVCAISVPYVYFLSYSFPLLISFFVLLVSVSVVINILKRKGIVFV